MATSNPQADSYKNARLNLESAIKVYQEQPSIANLVAVYQAQNAVRAAASDDATTQNGDMSASGINARIKLLKSPEAVPGERLSFAEQMLTQVEQAMKTGGKTSADNKALSDAHRLLQQYIQTASAGMQDNDGQFADEYSRLTGQPPPQGTFNSSAFAIDTPPSTVPDEGARPPASAFGAKEKPTKRTVGKQVSTGINIEPLPYYAPYDALADYRQSGLDVSPGTGQTVQQIPGMGPSPSATPSPGQSQPSDSVQAANQELANSPIRQSSQGILQAGSWLGADKQALQSGRLVFTGYQTRNTKYIDEDNPRLGTQITTTKTPSYQSTVGLTFALGKPGFPGIAEYQKQMGLPVTGHLDDNTMKAWQSTIGEAAMNTAGGYNMTVQEAMSWQVKRAQMAMAQQRAAMAAAYNVDPTASAAILGSATKQIIGRLSTPAEDSEFHRAFNSANISTQGKVDAQQFARDWVRNKHPTEAGTMAGQDYYGAMFDVLTSGPGSLGSQAADING